MLQDTAMHSMIHQCYMTLHGTMVYLCAFQPRAGSCVRQSTDMHVLNTGPMKPFCFHLQP